MFRCSGATFVLQIGAHKGLAQYEEFRVPVNPAVAIYRGDSALAGSPSKHSSTHPVSSVRPLVIGCIAS